MKRLFTFAALLCATASAAQSLSGPWISTEAGTRFEYVGTVAGRRTTTQKVVKSVSDGAVILENRSSAGTMSERWNVYPDSTVLHTEAPRELLDLIGNLGVTDVEISGRDMALPARMSVGDAIPGFDLTLCGRLFGKTIRIEVRTQECRVAAVERLDTPAGTFDAVRLEMKTVTTLPGVNAVESTVTQWLAPGIGIVRQKTTVPGLSAPDTLELTKIVEP